MLLEIRHLRSLLAIDKCGSLARAAEQLHLTQSALSHQIRVLEEYYGTALFLRSTKPLQLTAAGYRLLALAERVVPEVQACDHSLRQFAQGRQGRLYIAIECHACFEWLIPVLDQYRRHWPDVDIDIRLDLRFEPLEALHRGLVDVVISSDRYDRPELIYNHLFDYEARLVLAHDHPLCARSYIEPQDLIGQTLVTYPVERTRLDVFKYFLEPVGMEPAEVRQAELTAIILLLVATLKGVAVLPDWVLRESADKQHLGTRPLGRDGLHGSLYAVVRQAESERAYLAAFVEQARSHAAG